MKVQSKLCLFVHVHPRRRCTTDNSFSFRQSCFSSDRRSCRIPPLLAVISLKMLEAAIASFPTEYTVHVITALAVGVVTFRVLQGLKTTQEGEVDARAVPLNVRPLTTLVFN